MLLTLFSTLYFVGNCKVVGLEIKIGALFTSGRCCDYLSYEDKASAMNIAIDQLYEDGVLNKNNVTFK